MVSTTWKGFSIEAYLDPEDDTLYGEGLYHHRVTVAKNNAKLTFSYWGTIVNPELNTHIDACYAFQWLVDRAIEGSESYDNYLAMTKNTESPDVRKKYAFCHACFEHLNTFLKDGAIGNSILALGALLHKSEQILYKE